MKARFPLIIFVLFVAASVFSSCTHEYTCQCSIQYSGEPGLPDSTMKEYTIKDSKQKAKKACEANSGTYTTGNITAVETCKIY